MSCDNGDCDFEVGQVAHITLTVTKNGALLDAVSVDLKVKDPDGTTTTPSVVHNGIGSYSADIPLTLPGQWYYRFESTSPDSAQEGRIIVRRSNVL